MLCHLSPLIWGYFWPTSTLLRGHIVFAIPSPPETDPQILEHWGYADEVHLGKSIRGEGFWSRMSAWRATAFVKFTRWIGFCMSELFRKIDEDFGGSISWKTQPNCRVFDELHTTGPWRSWLVSRKTAGFSVLLYGSCFFSMATALLSPFFWDLFLDCSSTWRCTYEHFSPKSATTLRLVEQAFWWMPLFTEWIGASSFEVILAWQSKLSTTGTLSSGTLGSRRISLILLHERTRRRLRLCHFCTLIDIVTETATVSFTTLPVGFPLPTISKSSLSTLFCSLILDHGIPFIISVSGPKVPVSNVLLDTSLDHSFQSVIIRS